MNKKKIVLSILGMAILSQEPIFADQVTDGINKAVNYIALSLGLGIAGIGSAVGWVKYASGNQMEGWLTVKNSLIGAAGCASTIFIVKLVFQWFK